MEPGVDATPILTWGVVDAVIEDVSSNNVPKNTPSRSRFRMPETPLREAIGDELKNKASKRYLSRHNRGANTLASSRSTPYASPSNASSPSHAGRTPLLSSAARELLRRTKRK